MGQDEYNILNLLPHRPPMLMVDHVIRLNDDEAVLQSVVKESWPLVEHGVANPLILIELVAQTAGIHNGWKRDKTEGSEGDKKGWIVGIKTADLPIRGIAVGTRLFTTTKNRFKFEGFREIAGTVKKDDEMVARIILQLLRSEDTKTDKGTS